MTSLPGITRKLTTILAADAANYSGRMAMNEVETVQALRRSLSVFETGIAARGGRIANTAGDGLIAEFPSVVEAVAAAIAIQRKLHESDSSLSFRIGLHLGDVIVEGDDLLGDGVNLAARLQDIAPEGGIFATRQIVDHARGRLDAEFRPMGPSTLKNLSEDVMVYSVLADGVVAPDDLQSVAPRTLISSSDTPEKTPHEKFRKSRNRAGFGAVALMVIDVLNGAGPSWPALGIAAIGISLYIKWRKLP